MNNLKKTEMILFKPETWRDGGGEDSFPRNRIFAVENDGLTSEDIRAIPQTLSRPFRA
jgi:hypothetical protein